MFESFRTPERQAELYAQGRSKPGKIVTKAKPWQSFHQYGCAADFVLHVDGKWSWETSGSLRRSWERLHEIGRANGLEPLSWELPHLQIAGLTLANLQSGLYPALGDDDWAENLAAAIAGWTGNGAPPPPEMSGRPALAGPVKDDPADEEAAQPTAPHLVPAAGPSLAEQPAVGLTLAVIRAAQRSNATWGVPVSVILAQFILESAGGKKMPPGSNNPFGIKARSDEPAVSATTIEVEGGAAQSVVAKFRKFASFDEAFDHHGRLLATSKYYVGAMAVKHDPVAFCHALTGIYATDPHYGDKLVAVIGKYALTQYDAGAIPRELAQNDEADAMAMRFGDKGENIRGLQNALKAAGYGVGGIDGIFGTLTRSAVLTFQADQGLPTTGIVDAATFDKLNGTPQRPLAHDRVLADEATLIKEGSRTVREASRTKLLGIISAVLGGAGLGNSALVNAVDTGEAAAPVAATVDLQAFLASVQRVLGDPVLAANPQELRSLAEAAAELARLDAAPQLPPDVARIVGEIARALPADVLARNPDIAQVVEALGRSVSVTASGPRTIVDLLPTIFAPDSPLHGIAEGLATVAASFVPGLGGSALAVAAGLFAHHFGKKISDARVAEHRAALNINR
ncbi:Exo-glucosaminidase LytG precursor [Methylobrevis pamukkalensis]|uniref:Exo-glucosaminidase LytG n=1 Tax=Methylobrevis pamukkalensis TaxID=1439726 RepID=A0A1E3H2X7_9HYPH|nr:Exo-glucosaminidase LytG precursor [Methylobrevis pamukkalensis]